MKKLFLSVTIFVFMSNLCSGQNAFYDALMFDDLNKNGGAFADFSNPSVIQNFLKDPFDHVITTELNNYLPKLRTEYSAWINSKKIKPTGVPGITNLLSGISPGYQSMIIDAIAKVVAEDFQEGLTVVYINRFKERLKQIPELQAFFPKTYQFFIDTNPFDYPKLGSDFRTKFEEDLESLVINVKNYMNSPQADAGVFKDFKTNMLFIPYCVASDIGDKIIKGYHPIEILDFLEKEYDNSQFKSYYTAAKLINIVQRNFQKGKTSNPFEKQFENVWIQYKELKTVSNDPTKAWYLVGLIYQQDVTFFSSLFPVKTKEKINEVYKNAILPSVEILMNIDNMTQKNSMNGEDLGQVLSSVFEVINKMNKTFSLIPEHFLTIAGKLSQIYTSIAKKDYSSVVPNLVYIIDEIDKTSNNGSQTARVMKVTAAFMKYGTFITDVVAAKNSDDLKNAYKKATVNRGTFMDKRISLSSLTISAHPGFVGGYERLSETEMWEWNIGITAPIGFEFTWGCRGDYDPSKKALNYVSNSSIKSLKGSSWGLMLAFADIGSVFNYRLNDKDSELPESLTFKQIFSPGFAFHYGFKNSPLTLGTGIQYTPELRKVTADDITVEANSFKAFLRLTYDVPLLKIYYKKEK